MQKTFNVTTSSVYPIGVCFVPEGLHISMICENRGECGIILYDKNHKDGIKIPIPVDFKKGSIYSMLLQGYDDINCSYLFYDSNGLYQDPYALALENDRKYGELINKPSRCKVHSGSYDWKGDSSPAVPFEDSIFYMLHVRGFTKHRSSGVKCKGTYAGVTEKIPYLKELGITAVILMPCYEFDEVFHDDKKALSMEQAAAAYKDIPADEQEQGEDAPVRINYWGYQEGLYFMPKYAYSYSKDAVTEFKDMVRLLHMNGIEVIMQFYLPSTLSYVKILEIIRHWVIEYHIDGFQLMGVDVPIQLLANEPLLTETKLIGEKDYPLQPASEAFRSENEGSFCNFGYMNDAFLYDIRKLLKGDSGMIESFIHLCRKNSKDKGIVNYIAKQDGFRLYDLVSYNSKHNEANGEDNRDGNPDNYSWNCGIEGKTRKKAIHSLRMKQMKNAMTFVMLSQGTPLIYCGDEFANSQDGNNNPYCQDNQICWIKWNLLGTNEELFNYTKELIKLRKSHPIMHMGMPLRGIDYKSCGYPDISFHGREAWIPDMHADSRSLGIMYCGYYGDFPDKKDDSFIYIGINMHWEPYTFGLPQMPKEFRWVKLFSTSCEHSDNAVEEKTTDESNLGASVLNVEIPPRTIVIYGTEKCERKKVKKNAAGKKGHSINVKSMDAL